MSRELDMPVASTDRSSDATDRVAVKIRSLSKTFEAKRGKVEALRDVDLDIRHGEFVCIVGPSGCGKTTLLNIVAELAPPTHGRVEYDVPESDRPKLSVVFQEQGVFPWMSVRENAAFGLMARGVSHEERDEIAMSYLKRMGLAKFADAYPRTLSGGMRQRVNLARAFANDPEILLMDEPFASLDEQTKLILQDDLLHVWEGSAKTVIFITHSLGEAIRLADRVIVMSARPGRVLADVTIDLSRPRDLFELATNERYLQLHAEVWAQLRDEVLAAQQIEHDEES